MADEPPNFFFDESPQPNGEGEYGKVIAFPSGQAPGQEIPTIAIRAGKLSNTATQGEMAILDAGFPIYQRGIALVRPVQQEVRASGGRTTMAAGLTHMTPPGMRDALSQAAKWTKYDARSKKDVPTDPPKELADVILSRVGLWKAPTIAGVITTPTMRPDGSIIYEAGYDPVTRLYHAPDSNLKPDYIPDKPTGEDAQSALTVLNSLIDEFPFVSELDRSVALSGIITAVVRAAMPVAPLHVVKANTAGTGKSFLVDVISAILSGRLCPVLTVSPKPEETEARLTGELLRGRPLISFDNVNGEFGSDLLNVALTQPTITVRKLGASDMYDIEACSTFFATGNGIRVRADMTRRTVICNLDAGVEFPEMREFQHNPIEDILNDRGRYLAAALTIPRAYVTAGYPDKLPPLAGYREWSDLVRSCLVWLGLPDPVDSLHQARADDPELAAIRALLVSWETAIGANREITVRAVIVSANNHILMSDGELEFPDFRDSLVAIAGTKGNIDARRLGQWLLKYEGRLVDGRHLKRGTPDSHTKVATWKVVVQPPIYAGTAGITAGTSKPSPRNFDEDEN